MTTTEEIPENPGCQGCQYKSRKAGWDATRRKWLCARCFFKRG